MNKNRVAWSDGANIFVIRKGKTSNKKITDGSEIVQTYTFSREQYEIAHNETNIGMKRFFALDGSNCLDCGFSGNSGNGGCYTHKFNQFVGFLSMLRSLSPIDLGPLSENKKYEAIRMSMGSYVRFGTYGEPSLLPYELVANMAAVSSSYTGYTHQWNKDWARKYRDYFMASVHDANEAHEARAKTGYRSFIATKTGDEDAVHCPASTEMGFKTNCARCGLCSGLLGKGKKDVKILEH